MLSVEGIEVSYGRKPAVFHVDLSVGEGQAVALLGRNGVGKTTTIKAITGALRPSRGRISLGGTRVDTMEEHRICLLGLGYVPEGRRIFRHLSVDEQLVAFARPERLGQGWTRERIFELFPSLLPRRNSPGGLLSGGEQQMLAIGRALSTSPRLLILDEATEGLAPMIRDRIWEVLGHLKSQGLAILVVDKNLVDVVSLADHAYILEKGCVAWEGVAAGLADPDERCRRLLAV